MINKRTEILDFLRTFHHGHHTNMAKGIMNNRDACAFIFWRLGPTKVVDVISLLNEWRGPSTDRWTHGRPLLQTYLFNSSRSGGYGCVADEPMQRGWNMCNEDWSGIVTRRCSCSGRKMPKTFFRRTYWYRLSRGIYAPTVECAKRMGELGLH